MATVASDGLDLLDLLIGERDADRGPAPEEREPVAALLTAVIADARGAWPELCLADEPFVRHIARHLPPDRPVEEGLLALRGDDLYLAFGCALRGPAAMAAFDETFASELRRVCARLPNPRAESEDLAQDCRHKLFARLNPKIAEYSGQGDLRHWLRVTLMRMLIDHQRSHRQRKQREVLVDGATSLEVPEPRGDVELAYLKQHYGAVFRSAFERAVSALEPSERIVLRQHFADGLTIDQLASLYSIHRATAARRVAKARNSLLRGTRRVIMADLKLDCDELDSVMRLIESNVHVSVKRLLSTD